MKSQNILLFFSICLIFQSCKKDEPIEPELNKASLSEYFPAYPGSWWNYSLYSNESFQIEMDTGVYQINEEPILAPKFKNIAWYVEGGNIKSYQGGFAPGTASWVSAPIFEQYSEDFPGCTVPFGQLHIGFFYYQSPQFWRELVTSDTTVSTLNGTVFNNVIMIKETNLDTTQVYYDYFSKNIGLVKRDSMNTANTAEFIEILSLDDYMIGSY